MIKIYQLFKATTNPVKLDIRYLLFKRLELLSTIKMKEENDYNIPFDEETVKKIYPQYSHNTFQKMLSDKVIDRALGCMFGSFIGDSLGAFLQFQKQISQQMIDEAMKMNGGGTFMLRAGQITDDSQLAFHMLNGLRFYNKNFSLKQQINELISKISLQYLQWSKSKPFDIGNTCRSGLSKIQLCKKELQSAANKENILGKMYKTIYDVNKNSQSNGSLMKIAPMSFFLSLIEPKNQDIKVQIQLITKELQLLHPNEITVHAVKLWALMLKCNILRNKDQDLKQICQSIITKAKQNKQLALWIHDVESKEPMSAKHNIGWAKIAWTHGMRNFKQINSNLQGSIFSPLLYKDYIRATLRKGGDTDTNAAIIGGLLGSIIGFKNLPAQYIRTMMNLRFPQKKETQTDRKKFYEPVNAFIMAYQLIEDLADKNYGASL